MRTAAHANIYLHEFRKRTATGGKATRYTLGESEADEGERVRKYTAEAFADEDIFILRRRFIREVKVQRQLGADFVMPILDAGLEEGPPLINDEGREAA